VTAAAVRPSLIVTVLAAAACHATAPTVRLKPDTTDVSPNPARSASPALTSLRHDLDAILDAPALAHSYWGVSVQSLRSGETLYERNARRLLMPASNMKIVTLAAAAERLGWDFTTRPGSSPPGRSTTACCAAT